MASQRNRATRRAATARVCTRRRDEYKYYCRLHEDEVTHVQPGRFKKNTPWAFAATPKRLHGRPRMGYETNRSYIYRVRQEARQLRDAVRSGRFDVEEHAGAPCVAAVMGKIL